MPVGVNGKGNYLLGQGSFVDYQLYKFISCQPTVQIYVTMHETVIINRIQ